MRATSFGAALFLFSGFLGGSASAQVGEALDVLAVANGPATGRPRVTTA